MAAKKTNSDGKRFPLDSSMTIPHRMAACLDWFITVRPHRFIPWTELYQQIMGQAALPRANNVDVLRLKGRLGPVRKILHERYGRSAITLPGVGVRATVDVADRAKYCGTKALLKHRSTAKAVERELTVADIRKIPDTEENHSIRQWLQQHQKSTLASANDLLDRTLQLTSGKK